MFGIAAWPCARSAPRAYLTGFRAGWIIGGQTMRTSKLGEDLMNTMQKWTLAATITCFALPALAQNQNAWDQADENACPQEFLADSSRRRQNLTQPAFFVLIHQFDL